MKIGYTMAPGRGDTDLLLQGLATSLADAGLRAIGTVQINTERKVDDPCDMDVLVLPDGPVIRISQSLGSHAKGCRLDPGALETAVGHVAAELERGADIVLINKFGKHEAEGHGFRSLIGEVLARDIPILVGLNQLNVEPFQKFTDGLAQMVEPTAEALLEWAKTATESLDSQSAD